MKRPVILLCYGDESYGSASAALNFAEALKQARQPVCFVFLRGGDFSRQCFKQKFKCYSLQGGSPPFGKRNWGPRLNTLWHLYVGHGKASRSFYELCKKLKPRAIHLQWPALFTLGGPASKGLQIPMSWEVASGLRSPALRLKQALLDSQVRRWNVHPLANSKFTAGSLGMSEDRVQVMYLGSKAVKVASNSTKLKLRRQLKIPKGAIVTGICARLLKDKGQSMLVRAAKNLSLHLLFVGGPTDGAEADALRKEAIKTNSADRVHLVGYQNDPAPWYAVMDFSVSARISPEWYGLSVIESMLVGTPVLAFDLGGPSEILNGEQGGWLVAPTEEALAKGLKSVVALKPSDRLKMGRLARQRAMSMANQKQHWKNYEKALKDWEAAL